ncbi:MAG: transporter substrate-binding domain-containing protein [Phascolarctobacterium sp.]|uniref:ABC transporter substrate-binding protein n=1 Tax=Phascolarctobacterium sp. TaxID=2049039 RepID=UPI0026DD0FFA|nr:transporter substrate-binding domain-containing protein [Phascolarctobacterium sp.]MDO4920532.1 transporter substrate-binding domain-containing protein [Phascolarctobacterium sp.]
MKKLLLLVFCVLLAVAMAGCGNSSKEKAAGKILKVATDANFPPYEYYQEKTKVHTGFDIGLMNALAKSMGYDKVEYINVDFKDILTGLNEKKYDAAIAGMTITPEREKLATFTEPYVADSYRIIVAKNKNGKFLVSGKTVAVEEGSYSMELARQNGAAKLLPVKGVEETLKAVSEGLADCAVASSVSAGFFIAHGYGDKVKFADEKELLTDNIGIAVAKDNKALAEDMNKALAELRRSGEYKNIYSSYFGAN